MKVILRTLRIQSATLQALQVQNLRILKENYSSQMRQEMANTMAAATHKTHSAQHISPATHRKSLHAIISPETLSLRQVEGEYWISVMFLS